MLIPADGRLVEIDEDLLRFEIFFEAPRAKFAAEARLFVATPRRFNVGRLHVIDPDDAGAERFHDAESFIDVARPDSGGEAIGRVVGDADGVSFTVEGNHGCDWAENFFAGDTCGVVHVVENRRLNVETFAELLRAAAADGNLCLFLADFQVRANAIVLFFTDERTHLCFALAGRTEFDALRFLGHGFDEFGIDFLFDKDPAACGADFALVDEHAEECAVDGGFPIGIGEENVGRFAAEFECDAFESVRSTFDNDFADSGAASESNLIHAGMRYERGARGFAEAIDDVHNSGRQTYLG